MTKEDVKQRVRDILTGYLETYNHRKTSERFAILDAVYDMKGHFSIDELKEKLEGDNFYVSRATLYNTMRLFIEMRLVVRHRFIGQTKYEGCYNNDRHVHQICTVCGTVVGIDSPEIADAIADAKMPRFRKDGFSLYIYGICSRCKANLARQRNRIKQQKQKKSNGKRKS